MELKQYKLSELKPYENNPRRNDEAVQYVANSISEFGFKIPIVIDKNNVIVCGHTRYKAAKQLKLKSVPCIMADDLTDEQIKAFRLADNKTAEISEWDFGLLSAELETISDIDMSDFSFNIYGFETQQEEAEQNQEEEKENERERTYKQYNLQYNDIERTVGKYQMPIIEKQIIETPKQPPIGFNYMLSTEGRERGIHCFLDDYQIERLWNSPEVYAEKLIEFPYLLSPDYSLYLDMPIAMQIWNTYRSRLVGQIMQDYGVNVIPTVSWGLPETFEFCFDGIEQGSIVAVSTIGVKRDETATKIWRDGMDAMIKKIKPSAIWCYGGKVEYDYKGIPVTYFDNEVTEKMKSIKAEEK